MKLGDTEVEEAHPVAAPDGRIGYQHDIAGL
jgi:hypothetical protein